MTATAVAAPAKGHPPGLYLLFFTEMWERFSYYGMRAILVYYMTKQLMFSQEKASQTYGLYTGLVYLTPLLGGMIADRFIGQRRSVIIGGVLMAIGEFVLMVQSFFWIGLAFLILGNGMFKPNISTQVGSLYPEGDSRRDSAFSIFYVGINLGAMLSPLICGTIGELYGWHLGFGAAGIGMLAGLALYMWGQHKYLAPDRVMEQRATAKAGKVAAVKQPLSSDEKSRILALVVLCVINILFWGIYEQQGNTMALFADANTERHLFGAGNWEIPASWVQSINPFFICVLTPIVTSFWAWQAKRSKEPSSVAKMAIGCFLLGISFIFMIPAANVALAGAKANMWWLISCIFTLTIGELYLSPVGLSLVTKVAPSRMVSMMMGFWFLSSFVGNYMAGFIGTFWEKMPKTAFFWMLVVMAGVAGLAFLVVGKPLKKAMGIGTSAAT